MSSAEAHSTDTLVAPTSSGSRYNEIYINLGKFSDEATPEFRPSSLTARVGDLVQFTFNSVLDTYTIVQAKSAEEPCTRDPNGLYVEAAKPTPLMKNDPDIDQKISVGYGWVFPPRANGSTIHFYTEGHCEQGMRAQFVVSGFASPEYPGSSWNKEGTLSKSAQIGIIVGVTVAALLLVAVVSHFIYRKIRAKKTEKMKGRVAHMVVDAPVIAHDDGRGNRPSTQGAATSSV